mgnify:CR=1 FL=1
MTDDAFHVMRFPSGHEDFSADNGRLEGATTYENAEFRADSRWADAPQPKRVVTSSEVDRGAFKTPSLRGALLTAPYGHGGGLASLEVAIEYHRTRGMAEGARLATGKVDPWFIGFDAKLAKPLLDFVGAIDFAR